MSDAMVCPVCNARVYAKPVKILWVFGTDWMVECSDFVDRGGGFAYHTVTVVAEDRKAAEEMWRLRYRRPEP